jgi:lipoyl(octanoyl) transferase
VEDRLAGHLAAALGRQPAPGAPDLRTISVVVVREDGKVLALKRSPERGSFWQPVTGRLEPGEEPQAAAQRELLEETGFDAPVRALAYRHAFALDPAVNRVRPGTLVIGEEVAFAATVPAGVEPRLSDEHAEHAWITPAEMLERIPFAGLRRAVRLATAGPAGRVEEALASA